MGKWRRRIVGPSTRAVADQLTDAAIAGLDTGPWDPEILLYIIYLIGLLELARARVPRAPMGTLANRANEPSSVDLLPEPRRRPPDDLGATFDVAARHEWPRLADALL